MRFLPALLLALAPGFVLAADERPNLLLVVVDDMGYSDLGCYGGEIDTPNLDALARGGLRFTQFYNCAKCETTRATLLSGRYYPEVGVGKLQDCVTIAEALRGAGYTTLMTGKWHQNSTPTDRGFDRYFGHLSGATNYFTGDDTFRLDGEKFEVPKQGFYTTDANTDHAIRFLNDTQAAPESAEQPFFLYVAYNAPHYPLQAPKEDVLKYRGKYAKGWDELRRERHARQRELGVVAADWPLSPRPDDVPAWEDLSAEDRRRKELMMETYAAMIDRLDRNVGRLVEHLKSIGEYDNTLILFFSDNGACPFQRTEKATWDQVLDPWDPASYWVYDKGWAHACNTPFREYKQNQHEGGISTAMIAHAPAIVAKPGTITDQPGHLVDVMATALDLAGAEYPTEYEGRKIGPARGLSLKPILEGRRREPHEAIWFSFYGKNNALRDGDWKLVNRDGRPFELYDMAADRTELHDLAREQPERLEAMTTRWQTMNREFGGQNQRQVTNPNAPKKRRNEP
jgi:arylsulfatase A-like enzyme